MPGLSLALGVVACSSAALAGELRVEIRALPCSDPERVAAALRHGFARVLASQPDLTLTLDSLASGELLARLEGPAGAVERILSLSEADCEQLPALIRILAHGWLDRRWSEPPPVVHLFEPPPAQPAASQDAARADQSEAGGERRGALLTPSQPARAAAREGSGAELAGESDIAAAPPSPDFRLVLGGGASLDARERSWTLTGTLVLERDFGRIWGVAVRGGLDGPIRNRLGPGRVAVSGSHLAILARRTLLATGEARLDLLAGLGVALLSAETGGFAIPSHVSRTFPAAAMHVRWRQPLSPRLELLLGADLLALRRGMRVSVEDVGPGLKVGPTRLALVAGLGWRPF